MKSTITTIYAFQIDFCLICGLHNKFIFLAITHIFATVEGNMVSISLTSVFLI